MHDTPIGQGAQALPTASRPIAEDESIRYVWPYYIAPLLLWASRKLAVAEAELTPCRAGDGAQ